MPFLSLKTKLIILSLIVSSILTGGLTVIGIGQDSQRLEQEIEKLFTRFEKQEKSFFTDRMWLMDYRAINTAAQNLIDDDELTNVVIIDARGNEVASAGKSQNLNRVEQSFSLVKVHNGREITLGKVMLSVVEPTIWDIVKNRLLTLLLVNGFLVSVIFGFSYLFFYRTVLRDLEILTRFAQSADINLTNPSLPKPIHKRRFADEISQLTQSIGDFAERIANELSRRKQAENDLKQSEYRHRVIFENSPLGMIRMDHEGYIIDCNNKFVELMGSSREKLIGFNGAALSSPKMQRVIKKALAGQSATYEDEYTSITGNKKTFLRVVYNPVNPGQSPTDIIATLEDVSARKAIENELRASGDRLQAIFRAISDPILIHPYSENELLPFSEITDAACERYGFSRHKFLTLNIADISDLNHSSVSRLRDRLKQIQDHGRIVFESVHKTRNAENFPVEVSVSLLNHAGVPSVLWVVRDLTERYRAELEKDTLEGQLRQAQKLEAVGRLAGGVAHDFNNMLGVILGYTEMALDEVGENKQLYHNLLEVKKAADYSADLTRQLLAFARKQPITPKQINLNETIREMQEVLGRMIREGIDLQWHPGPDLWPVKMDPSQIKQILINLTLNARDAINGDGQITISTKNRIIDEEFCLVNADAKPGEYVQLSVSDSGKGMSVEQIDNIFEPFFTTKAHGEGTGLGLSTVYGILKQNSGFVTVSSIPGKGTIFNIFFPSHKTAAFDQISATDQERSNSAGSHTILLVEDEHAILKMVSAMLKQMGYNVLPANSPSLALQLAREHKDEIKLLMTDVIMPEMNGRQLADKLIEEIPEILLLFMSGYTADVIAQHGVLDDGINFLQKPFTKKDLASSLDLLFTAGSQKQAGKRDYPFQPE